jgi:hypothetical protein
MKGSTLIATEGRGVEDGSNYVRLRCVWCRLGFDSRLIPNPGAAAGQTPPARLQLPPVLVGQLRLATGPMTDPCDYAHYWSVPTIPGGVIGQYVYVPRASLHVAPPCMEDFDHTKAEGRLTFFLRTLRTDFHRWSHELDWTLESGPPDAPSSIEIGVPYSYSEGCDDYFAGGCWNPGDPIEIETGLAYFIDENGVRSEVCLLEPEQERVQLHIAENPPEPDYGDDY